MGFNEVNARDDNDKTLLHFAATAMLTEVCQEMQQRHAFVTVGARDCKGQTATENNENAVHTKVPRYLHTVAFTSYTGRFSKWSNYLGIFNFLNVSVHVTLHMF